MPDDKNMFSLVVKPAVKLLVQQFVQHFSGAFFVCRHSDLPVINVAPSAAGSDRKLVVIGQVLRGGDTAAALCIVTL